jgi:hypothetical protein
MNIVCWCFSPSIFCQDKTKLTSHSLCGLVQQSECGFEGQSWVLFLAWLYDLRHLIWRFESLLLHLWSRMITPLVTVSVHARQQMHVECASLHAWPCEWRHRLGTDLSEPIFCLHKPCGKTLLRAVSGILHAREFLLYNRDPPTNIHLHAPFFAQLQLIYLFPICLWHFLSNSPMTGASVVHFTVHDLIRSH